MPDWDGRERRRDDLTQVRAELSTVRDALVHVAEGMESFVSTDEIDRRISYERRQRNKLSTIIGIGVLVAVLSTFVSIAQLRDLHDRSVRNRNANRIAQQITIDAVSCIIHSLNQHRDANEFAHQLLAKKIGAPYDEPPELHPPVEEPSQAMSCDRLNAALTQTRTSSTSITRGGGR